MSVRKTIFLLDNVIYYQFTKQYRFILNYYKELQK